MGNLSFVNLCDLSLPCLVFVLTSCISHFSKVAPFEHLLEVLVFLSVPDVLSTIVFKGKLLGQLIVISCMSINL